MYICYRVWYAGSHWNSHCILSVIRWKV